MKRQFYHIEGRKDIIRDAHSKGLITTDHAILRQEQARISAKNSKQAQEDRLNTLENRLERIETLLLELAKK